MPTTSCLKAVLKAVALWVMQLNETSNYIHSLAMATSSLNAQQWDYG